MYQELLVIGSRRGVLLFSARYKGEEFWHKLRFTPEPGVVVHTFNPCTFEAEAGGSLMFETCLVYKSD